MVSRLEGESLGGSAHTSSSDSDSDIDGDHMLGPLSPCAESPRPWQQGGKGCVDTRASGEGVLSMPPPVLGAAGGGGGMGGSRPVSGRPSSGRPGSGRPGSAARGAPMAAASGAQQPAFGVRAVHPELRLGRTLSMSMTYEDIPVEDLSEGEPDCMEGVSEVGGRSRRRCVCCGWLLEHAHMRVRFCGHESVCVCGKAQTVTFAVVCQTFRTQSQMSMPERVHDLKPKNLSPHQLCDTTHGMTGVWGGAGPFLPGPHP